MSVLDWLAIIVTKRVASIRPYLSQLKLRYAVLLYALVGISQTVLMPFDTVYRFAFQVMVATTLLMIISAIWIASLDFWAQFRGIYTKLKLYFKAMSIVITPIILILPVSLLCYPNYPDAQSLGTIIILLWVIARLYSMTRALYNLTVMATIRLLLLPVVSLGVILLTIISRAII